jgi:hypothetical protein
MNPNIKALIDAAPKGVGGQWISIRQAEHMIEQAVRAAAHVARDQTLARSGLGKDFSGTVDVETGILDHFGL